MEDIVSDCLTKIDTLEKRIKDLEALANSLLLQTSTTSQDLKSMERSHIEINRRLSKKADKSQFQAYEVGTTRLRASQPSGPYNNRRRLKRPTIMDTFEAIDRRAKRLCQIQESEVSSTTSW